ncbi:hypothetical protein SAMN05443245_6951 [Paraburkholderia fungorum]|uniref:Uncharacterized protein n=2 Tax=Paraburkholderia fungorum TaxID=134537 RepID=A0A1H1JNK7_9BURK|nr:hypothetical protein SAMN05443245_6951 [Paraburkholderia fungorum]
MRFQYKRWIIDATPDIFEGKFQARARVAPGNLADDIQPDLIDETDLGCFAREALAVEHAINWAIAWIDSLEAQPVVGR